MWTYSGDPRTSKRDEVRFHIGDTDTDDQLLQDEEIEYSLTQEQNVLLAAASCARAVVAKFSRESDKEVGELKVTLSQRAKAFRDLADSLQARGQSIIPPTTGGTALAAPYSGTSGTSGTFSRGMMSR